MTSHAGMYSSSLAVTENQWLEQVTTDIPFLTVGIAALACVTCLLLTQRLSIPAACILISAFFAFNGAIFDFARLLQVSKDTSNTSTADSGPFAIVVLREISFSLSIALNYLFFLVYLGRPPRGEVQLADPAERRRARRESPSRWAYWGWIGYLTQAFLVGAIVAVAVLEVLWRVTKKPRGTVYRVDGIVEGVIILSFMGKIILNTYLSPLIPRWKTLRDYSPAIFALSTRLGIIITDEFCAAFTEAPLGRLLQAIQLYVLIVLVLVSPYYGIKKEEEEPEQLDTRRASSFRGLRWSTVSKLSALNTDPRPYNDSPPNARGSPSQRLSSWINNRLATRKDPSEDRLWNKDKPDLEAPPTPGDRIADDVDSSPLEPRFIERIPTATWQGPFLPDPLTPEAGSNPVTPNTAGQVLNITANLTPAPPNPTGPNTAEQSQIPNVPAGRFIGKFEINENYESDSDSPIYGINGIIQKKAARNERKRRSRLGAERLSAVDQLKKEQEELERSVASMAAFSPSKSDFGRRTGSSDGEGSTRADYSAAIPSYLTGGGLSESVKSDFSLRDFPSPPASVFANALPSNGSSLRPEPMPSQPPVPKDDDGNDLEIVEDVQFAMVPPRMPAAYSRRRASFPAVARESATSSLDGVPRIISAYADSEDDVGKRVRMSSANNRLDVTSFIGELTTPQSGRPFGQIRGDSRRMDSIDSRLSPLPEDASSRPSVEIVDMRLTSPTFTPAIAISTSDKSPVAAQRIPKVSFAPVTYDATGRPKMKGGPILLNTLPASPRPTASPNGSPRSTGQFKPTTSSPLANTGLDISSRRILERQGTVPGILNTSRPLISNPMPLKVANEKDYQSTRRAPNPTRTQRFL